MRFPFLKAYPGTNLHELDLDYVLRETDALSSLTAGLKDWAEKHEAEYEILADKVEGLINQLIDVIVPWDSSLEYPIYSIVEYQGTNYIAVQGVPVGVMITNTDYWQPANTVVEQINAIGATVSDLGERQKGLIVSPMDFGAAGDGVTDDTAALQAAVNFAQETGAILRIDEDFLTSAVLITAPIKIEGPGTLRQMPFYYTTLAGAVSAGSTQITVTDASHIHVGQTVIVSGDMLTVEAIEGNVLTVSHYMINNPGPGTNSAHSAGGNVTIGNNVLVIAKTLGYDATPSANGTADVSGVSIRGVHFAGTKAGYQTSHYTLADVLTGYQILGYRVEDVLIENCVLHDGPTNAILFNGFCRNITIKNCRIYNIDGSLYSDTNAIEANAAVCFHWDTGIANALNVASSVYVVNNDIENCIYGVFASAANRSHFDGNSIRNTTYAGIVCYRGDLGYPTNYDTVSNNSITTEAGIGIQTTGVGDIAIVGNTITAPIALHFKTSTVRALVASNIMASTQYCVRYTGVLYECNLQNNALTLARQNVDILHFDDDVQGELRSLNNRYIGTNTSTRITNDTTLTNLIMFFVGDVFINCRGIRTKYSELHVWQCMSNDFIFALMSERNAADMLECRENGHLFSSPKYQSGTTAEKTALTPVYAGMLFYDTTLAKLCVYTGSAWSTVG